MAEYTITLGGETTHFSSASKAYDYFREVMRTGPARLFRGDRLVATSLNEAKAIDPDDYSAFVADLEAD